MLVAAVLATVATWAVFRLTARLPVARRLPALLGYSEPLVDLHTAGRSARRPHPRSAESPVTVVEYGDFECPYCGRAEPVVRELLADQGDVRYVWRHLPLEHVHPHAALAAEAAEAAGAQDAFWPMHDLLLTHQHHLTGKDLVGYAEQLGLDVDRFRDELGEHKYAGRVAEDVQSARAERRGRNPDVLHQRAAALRRLRHRDPHRSRRRRPGARGRHRARVGPPPRPMISPLPRPMISPPPGPPVR